MKHVTRLSMYELTKHVRTCLAAVLLCVVATHGDTLVFNNDDVLTGAYIGEENGQLVFDSDLLGEIRISPDIAELVRSGESAAAAREPAPEETAARENASAETGDEPDSPEETDTPFNRGVDQARELFNYIVPDGWTGRLSAGVAFTETNVKTEDWNLNLRAHRESGNNTYRTHGFYQYKSQTNQAGATTRQLDKYGANLNWQRDLYDRFFLQSVSGYQRDRVKNLRHQINQSLGLGYRIFDTDRITLSATPSGTAQYKDGPGIDRRWIGYATLFQQLIYHINDALRIEQSADGSVNPSHPGDDYEYNTRVALIASLAEWIDASLSYENNYDNTVGSSGSRREEKVVFALGVPF